MRKAALLYNPLSGRRHKRRLVELEAALTVLREAGIEVSAAPTRGPAAAAEQVRQAIAEGCDTVLACGGDGTVHDVLQGLVGTSAAFGILPGGTANALAHDLGLPRSPARAARAVLRAMPLRIALGRVAYQDLSGKPASRYFAIALGAGMDANLFQELDPRGKARFGMLAYYAKATWLWLTHGMKTFWVSLPDSDGPAEVEVSQLLAVRIRNFGGILRELAPGASLDRDDLRLVLFRTCSRLAYLCYIVRGLIGARWKIGGIELIHSASAVCRPAAAGARVYLEADGEILGILPAEITMVPNALTLLVPPR
jgi:diacylglycerol kinase (ATP)